MGKIRAGPTNLRRLRLADVYCSNEVRDTVDVAHPALVSALYEVRSRQIGLDSGEDDRPGANIAGGRARSSVPERICDASQPPTGYLRVTLENRCSAQSISMRNTSNSNPAVNGEVSGKQSRHTGLGTNLVPRLHTTYAARERHGRTDL